MTFDSFRHSRHSIRLKGYDYSSEGAYFVTICTQNREMLLAPDPVRQMVRKTWDNLTDLFLDIRLDEFVIMPNHIHGIIWINRRGESCIRPTYGNDYRSDHKDRPYGTGKGTIGRIVQGFKSMTTTQYIEAVRKKGWVPFQKKLWQRNYYERIIRNEEELNRTRQYIQDNPKNWDNDPENPQCLSAAIRSSVVG